MSARNAGLAAAVMALAALAPVEGQRHHRRPPLDRDHQWLLARCVANHRKEKRNKQAARRAIAERRRRRKHRARRAA